MKEKIGIFGCSADPFTLAHREIVKQAIEQKLVDSVVIVPTIVDYHRGDKLPWLSSTEKINVIRALTHDIPHVVIDETELNRKDLIQLSSELEEHAVKSWRFIDTLLRIKLENMRFGLDKVRQLYPIIGGDSLDNFKTWFAWKDILKQSAGLIAIERDNKLIDAKEFMRNNSEFNGKLKTMSISKDFAEMSASDARETWRKHSATDYINWALAEIEAHSNASCKKNNALLHTPIFDVIKGQKTKTGLEPVLVNAPDWVTIIVESKGKFLVEKQLRYGSASIVEEFPCGMVEKGEDPLNAAVRELEEETGFKIVDKSKIVKIGQVNPNPAFMTNTMHYFYVDLNKVKYVKTKQKLDTHENIKFFFEDMDRFCQSALHKATSGNGKVPALLVAAMTLYGIYKMDDGQNGKHA